MPNAGNITVLVVDDEEGIREVLTMNLEMDGFKVVSASGAFEAIELLDKGVKVDFILSDVRMPKGDGVVLLKHVKEKFGDKLPIILLSGFAEISEEEVKNMGGMDLISKPPDIDHLVSLVKKHAQLKIG